MRNLLSKTIAGSMIVGATLLVAACGSGEDAAINNVATTELEPVMDSIANDTTAIDASNSMDTNATAGANVSMDSTTTDADVTNGM